MLHGGKYCRKNALKGFGNLGGEKLKSEASDYWEPGRTFHQRNWKAQRPKGRSMCGGSRSSQVAAAVGAQRGRVGGSKAGEEARGPGALEAFSVTPSVMGRLGEILSPKVR